MRADLTGTVTQTQPQYQTSELLIGALLQGYRVAEVPTVMRQRMSGESRKGRNLVYGLRYARVIPSTSASGAPPAACAEACARRDAARRECSGLSRDGSGASAGVALATGPPVLRTWPAREWPRSPSGSAGPWRLPAPSTR